MVDERRGPVAVTAVITGDDGSRFDGAAVLRIRPHPVTGRPALQLGVPDDALGFRPRRGISFAIQLADEDGNASAHVSDAVWLERIQSAWWFILEDRR